MQTNLFIWVIKKGEQNHYPLFEIKEKFPETCLISKDMVKVTIVGRVSDGLPLAQGLRYMNEENGYLSCYRQQAEFILQEFSRGALTASKMTIHIDNFCFKYPSFLVFSLLLIYFKFSFVSVIDEVVVMLAIFCYASYSSFTCTPLSQANLSENRVYVESIKIPFKP